MTGLCMYLVPNGRASKLFCPECMAQAPSGGDYVVRCDVGLYHVYACEAVSRGWLVGRKMCDPAGRTGLVVHARRLRASLDGGARKALDGFLAMFALARG